MARKMAKKSKSKSKTPETTENVVLNTLDNISEIVTSILANIKEENFKILTTDKELSYKQKMKLRNNMYVSLSILKALNNMYEYEEKAILDTTIYRTAMCVFRETGNNKLATLLKEGRESTIESYKELCDEIVKELDKLDESYTTKVVEGISHEDGTTEYTLKQMPLAKLDTSMINTIKKLIKTRETIKREQSKAIQAKINVEYFRGDTIVSRLNETLDYLKQDKLMNTFTPNMIRYILETMTIRFNILKNPDTTKPEKLEQMKEYNKIISSMDTSSFVNSATNLFDAHYNYTQLMHIYNQLEEALSIHQHTKKLVLLKELDTILSKLDKDIKKYSKTFQKCVNKTSFKKINARLDTYTFLDDDEVEPTPTKKRTTTNEDLVIEEPIVEEESIEDTDTPQDTNEDIDTSDDSDEEYDDISIEYDTDSTNTKEPFERIKVVNSRNINTVIDNDDSDLPELYEEDALEQETTTTNNSKYLSELLASLTKQKSTNEKISPTTESINEMVEENVDKKQTKQTKKPDKKSTPKPTEKLKTSTPKKDVPSIGDRLSRISNLLNKK